VFRRVSWLPGGGGLTAPIPGLTAPLWTAGFRVVSAVVGACVLRLLVVFVPRTSSTPVATWFWQTDGRSEECVILGVRPSEFILSEFQSPSRRIFIGSHSLPPLSGHLIGPSNPPVFFGTRTGFASQTGCLHFFMNPVAMSLQTSTSMAYFLSFANHWSFCLIGRVVLLTSSA
jgi:hypothetical protein